MEFNRYRVVAPMGVTFHPGTKLRLTDDQRARFAGRFDPAKSKKDPEILTAPVSFKKGMEFEIAGDVPKALLELLDEPAGKGKKGKPAPAQSGKPDGAGDDGKDGDDKDDDADKDAKPPQA